MSDDLVFFTGGANFTKTLSDLYNRSSAANSLLRQLLGIPDEEEEEEEDERESRAISDGVIAAIVVVSVLVSGGVIMAVTVAMILWKKRYTYLIYTVHTHTYNKARTDRIGGNVAILKAKYSMYTKKLETRSFTLSYCVEYPLLCEVLCFLECRLSKKDVVHLHEEENGHENGFALDHARYSAQKRPSEDMVHYVLYQLSAWYKSHSFGLLYIILCIKMYCCTSYSVVCWYKSHSFGYDFSTLSMYCILQQKNFGYETLDYGVTTSYIIHIECQSYAFSISRVCVCVCVCAGQ